MTGIIGEITIEVGAHPVNYDAGVFIHKI